MTTDTDSETEPLWQRHWEQNIYVIDVVLVSFEHISMYKMGMFALCLIRLITMNRCDNMANMGENFMEEARHLMAGLPIIIFSENRKYRPKIGKQ